jgi:hypothetical protein
MQNLTEVSGMDRVLDAAKPDERLDAPIVRQCAVCERCRDCGYTHIGIACPDPDAGFDGCLCDPELKTVA